LLEPLALDGGGLAAQRVIDGLLHLNMRRADGDARRGGDGLNHAAGRRGEQHLGDIDNFFARLAHGRQRLDFFTEAFFDGGQQRRQRIGGDARLGDQLQHLTTTGAEAEQLAQALDRHRAVLPSTMRTRISPSKLFASCARIFAGRACKPWALASAIRALGQSAGSSPPSTSSTARLLVARPNSWPRPSINNAHSRSSSA
jgi:hypothetical protein